MSSQTVAAFCLVLVTVSAARWRRISEDDSNPWTSQLEQVNDPRSEGLFSENDPSDWQPPKRFPFSLFGYDLRKVPIISSYIRRKGKSEKKGQDTNNPDFTIKHINSDNGVISCPPDYPKCIPRLGR